MMTKTFIIVIFFLMGLSLHANTTIELRLSACLDSDVKVLKVKESNGVYEVLTSAPAVEFGGIISETHIKVRTYLFKMVSNEVLMSKDQICKAYSLYIPDKEKRSKQEILKLFGEILENI